MKIEKEREREREREMVGGEGVLGDCAANLNQSSVAKWRA